MPTLILNRDFRPLSYFPPSLWNWQKTIKSIFLERVEIIHQYKTIIRSPSRQILLPSVVCLKRYAPTGANPAFTRTNIFLRDGFSCQYCSSKHDLTLDHVRARSRGGRSKWNNVVTACSKCNRKKGHHLPEEIGMELKQKPFHPSISWLRKMQTKFPPQLWHESWENYLT